jgi:DNA-binding XRE family transcriptional regulator
VGLFESGKVRGNNPRSGSVSDNDPTTTTDSPQEDPMALFRRLLGDVLRERRLEQGLTLRQVSAEARVSLGYISEIERGQKEASSELLASLCSALDAPLSAVLRDVSVAVAVEEAATAPTPLAGRRPVVASAASAA